MWSGATLPVRARAGERGRRPRFGRHQRGTWQRNPRSETLAVPIPAEARNRNWPVPDSGGLEIAVSVRDLGPVLVAAGVPPGTRVASVFAVNHRAPAERKDEAMAFQVRLRVRGERPFVVRPDLRSNRSEDWDDRVADLQYRDLCDFAVGHGIATLPRIGDDGTCREVSTCWIPESEVERVEPSRVSNVELEMEQLAALTDAGDARAKLGVFASAYADWIEAQRARLPDDPHRRETGEELLQRARLAPSRIERGIGALADPQVLDAFRIANRAMAMAARRRASQIEGSRRTRRRRRHGGRSSSPSC